MPGTLMLSVSGCRGIVGDTLTPQVAANFAGAYGSWLRERSGAAGVAVVIGRDGRAGGEEIHTAAMAGLASAGCRVINIGVAMTPTVAVMTDSYRNRAGAKGAVAGMVVTASHNPQQWNGLKCLLAEGGEFGSAACAPPASLAANIIERFKSQAIAADPVLADGGAEMDDTAVVEHTVRVYHALSEAGLCDYPERMCEGLKVAVDCVNASGRTAASTFLEELGCDEVLSLNVDESGVFPHPPEPTRENLTLPGGLCEAVREAQSDIGFAQDPDADRLALIDEQGRYVGEEYTLALGAMALLEASQRARERGSERASGGSGQVLVTNLSTSRMIDDVAARYGARVIRTAVGEANVVEVMKREKALAGGEGNGGVIWPRVTYVRDSLSAMALVLWLMSPQGGGLGRKRALGELVAGLPTYAIEKRKVDLARREDATPAIEKIAAAYKDQFVDRQDGAWVDFRTGPRAGKAWLHVRASNTEPIMRLIAEAPTAQEAQQLLDEASRIIGP